MQKSSGVEYGLVNGNPVAVGGHKQSARRWGGAAQCEAGQETREPGYVFKGVFGLVVHSRQLIDTACDIEGSHWIHAPDDDAFEVAASCLGVSRFFVFKRRLIEIKSRINCC